jgi:hypothetical protein
VKGADALPGEITAALADALVAASIGPSSSVRCGQRPVGLVRELDATDPELAARVWPVLSRLAAL